MLTILVLGALLAGPPQATPAAPPVPHPIPVTVGAYVNDIQNVDVKTHSYNLDVYIWFRWREPSIKPGSTFEFMNPYETWGHVKTGQNDEPEKLPNGEYYQEVRTQGRFRTKFDLTSYPFDRQVLLVELEDAELPARDLVFVPDSVPVRINPALVLPGFDLGAPQLEVTNFKYPTNFGDPRESDLTYSRVKLEIPMARPVLSYVIKVILPVFFVLLVVALMFMLHPRNVEAQLALGVTALLTLVALQLTSNANLPEVGYLVLIDKLYLSAYLFVISSLSVIVATTWLINRDQEARAAGINRRFFVGLSLVYLLVVGVLFGTGT